MLGLDGLVFHNILGNRDGEVLEDPARSRQKKSPSSVCWKYILQPQLYPQLYGKMPP